MGAIASRWRSLAACCLLALAAGDVAGAEPFFGEPSEADRQRYARRSLEDARAFRREGRLEAAERALTRGLGARPDDPQLQRLMARTLGDLGRPEEAIAYLKRADLLDPPPPPPSDEPLAVAPGTLVVLLPPEPSGQDPARLPRGWPHDIATRALAERLSLRLPSARVVRQEVEDVAEARAWLEELAPRRALSLRVDRLFCGETVKDGRFGLAWLRAAAEVPGRPAAPPRVEREIVSEPREPVGCEREVVARALEGLLAQSEVRDALTASPEPPARFSRDQIRALFPHIGVRLDAALGVGRRELARGNLTAATAAFRDALTRDPEDAEALAYLREAELTLAMSRALTAPRTGEGEPRRDPERLEPRLSEAQRSAIEAQLREERRRREDLLAAMAILDEDVELPPESALATLRPASVADPDGFGPRQARDLAGGPVVARAAYAPDGSLLALYYFPPGGSLPVLREEDTGADGEADRWIGYAGRARREIWESGDGRGRPHVHLVFGVGGRSLERVEIDANSDGRPETVFRYRDGALLAEGRDTTGDGRIDRFEHFDLDGNVRMSERDIDGDGQVDVRSVFRGGKLVRRELNDPKLAPDGT